MIRLLLLPPTVIICNSAILQFCMGLLQTDLTHSRGPEAACENARFGYVLSAVSLGLSLGLSISPSRSLELHAAADGHPAILPSFHHPRGKRGNWMTIR